jgi:glycosyltransferase involved in cell wall biosynthesis
MTASIDNLRVLHLDTGKEWRGGQGQVFTLMSGLQAQGVGQLLVAPPGSPLFEKTQAAGIATSPLKTFGELDPFAPGRLRAILDAEHISLVHAHDAHAHALALRALKHRPDVAFVVSRRVDFAISHHWFSRRKYRDPRIRYFAISNGVRDVLLAGGVAPERIRIVPSGVETKRFAFDVPRARLREEFGIPSTVPVVGTIGSLVDHKSHVTLVEAAPIVLEHFPEARFIIVGDGELRVPLQRRTADLGLGDRVRFPGFRSDIETFLGSFDAFVVSSHLEGLCTSLIDAMLFRLPCVGTDTGGIPDLIRDGETGLLVPVRNPDALAEAICRVLGDAALARSLGEAGRTHALAQFTAEALVRNTLEGYSAILDEQHPQ